MATQETIEKAKSWVEKEYDDLRYSKCQCKDFVFTFRELKEMAKKAFIAGHESEEGWQYPDIGEYPENKTTSDGQEYNPLVLVFFYRYDDYGKAAKVYALDRWEPDANRWQNNRQDKIEAWQYLPEAPGGRK